MPDKSLFFNVKLLDMKRACFQQNKNTYEKNHASSIRPLKINFVRMKRFIFRLFILLMLISSTARAQKGTGCYYCQGRYRRFLLPHARRKELLEYLAKLKTFSSILMRFCKAQILLKSIR